jgi:hypothetical protein
MPTFADDTVTDDAFLQYVHNLRFLKYALLKFIISILIICLPSFEKHRKNVMDPQWLLDSSHYVLHFEVGIPRLRGPRRIASSQGGLIPAPNKTLKGTVQRILTGVNTILK